MKHWLKLLAVAALLQVLLIGSAVAQEKPFSVVSPNAKYTIKGKNAGEAYQLTPLVPMKIKVKGPGTLELTLCKNYMPRESKRKMRTPAVVGIYLGTKKLKDVKVRAVRVKRQVYAEKGVKFRPGKGVKVKVDIPEGDQEVNLVVSPAADSGVGVVINFVPPITQAQPDIVPLVPIVPIAPEGKKGSAQESTAQAGKTQEVPLVPIVPPQEEKPSKKPVAKSQAQAKAESKPKPESKQKVAKAEPAKSAKTESKPAKKESTKVAQAQPKTEQPVAEAQKPAQPAETHYVRLTPFVGMNMPLLTGAGFIATYDVGLDAHYILPIPSLEDMLSVGFTFAYSAYSFTSENVPLTAEGNTAVTVDVDIDIQSLYFLFDTQFVFFKLDLLSLYADLGLGMVLGSAKYTPERASRTLYGYDWNNFKAFALSFGGGALFRVGKLAWNKDFFNAGLAVNYRMAQIDYKFEDQTVIENADHGGLAVELRLQFQF